MKGGNPMKDNILTTLFVGIDVSSTTNTLCTIDFNGKLLNLKVLNSQLGTESILGSIISYLYFNVLQYIVIALE